MSTKIVIRTPNHLGDCIMALPMINETGEVYPGSSVTLLVPENLASIYEGNPAIDELLTVPESHVHGLLAVFKIKELLQRHRFDIGYILPPSFGAAAGFKLGGVRDRIGYVTDGRRLLLSRPLALPTPLNATHRSELYFNLLRRGAESDITYVKPKLFLSDVETSKAMTVLRGFGLPEGAPYVSIAFRAVAESRRWGKANYIQLIKQIVSYRDMRVVLLGSSVDMREGEEISEATGAGKVINLAGRVTIREAAAILSGGKCFVGNDSGPAHLAAAVGIPVVVLSGADDPRSTSPAAAQKHLLYRDQLPCISCVENTCPEKNEDHMRCMRQITVEMVMAGIEKFVGSRAN